MLVFSDKSFGLTSWKGRCYGADLRINEGPEVGPKTWEKITVKAANPVFVAVSASKANWLRLTEREGQPTSQKQASMPPNIRQMMNH